MKIFISWSGTHSLGVATALREWLPYIFNDVELFVSSEDIRKGKRWPLEVSKELSASKFGIVCLTPDNLDAPWLLFEAGAISKSVQEASVYTLLVGGIRIGDIEGPLSHFQHTVFEKEDFFKLVESINDANERKQEGARLKKVFDKFWDDLQSVVSKLAKSESKPEKRRTTDEMLHELLETTNYIARNIATTDSETEEMNRFLFAKVTRPQGESATWAAIKERFGSASPFVGSFLQEATGSFSNGTLTILFQPEFADHVPLLDNDRNRALFQKVLAQLGLGDNCKIFIGTSPESPPIPPRPASRKSAPPRRPAA